ncbi:MAG: hypothetical protein ACOC6P_03015 [Candidatus Aminicenantaceae bacterium]
MLRGKKIKYHFCLNFILWGLVLLFMGIEAESGVLFKNDPPGQKKMEMGFKIKGGRSLFLSNDINTHLKGWLDMWSDDPAIDVSGEFETLKKGIDISGEMFINFSERFGISIGAGYIHSGKESSIENTWGSWISTTFKDTVCPEISAIPLTLSLHVILPVGSVLDVVFNAGTGYYIGKVEWSYHYKNLGNPSVAYKESWNAGSNAMGFHGGIALQWNINSQWAFFIGFKGRYVKLTELTGEYSWEYVTSDYSDSGEANDYTFWFGDYRYGSEFYSQMLLNDTKPSGSLWKNVRKGEVSLSGFSLIVGIKIDFSL